MAWKRFSVVAWVCAYTGLIGVPVWWATTSLERPQLPTATYLHFTPLPITFRVTLVTGQHGQVLDIPQNLQAALQEDAAQAYQTGVAENKAEDVAPLITVHVASTVSPDLCATPAPCTTEPPAYPPSSEDLEQLRALEQASEHAATAQRGDSQPQTPPGEFNIFLIHQEREEQDSDVSDSSIAWLGATRSAWVWLQGSTVDGAARCAVREVFRTVLHGFRQGTAGPAGSEARLPVSAASELTGVFTLAVAEPPLGVATWSIEDYTQSLARHRNLMHFPHKPVFLCASPAIVRLQEFWAPVKERLSPLLSLHIETQQRLFTQGRVLNPDSARLSGDGVKLSQATIPFFVDSDSWALESGRIVTGHTHPLAPDFHGIAEKLLHFVGYIPAVEEQPMHVDCRNYDSMPGGKCAGFVVAQWGGVVLMNSATAAVTELQSSPAHNVTGGDDSDTDSPHAQEEYVAVETGYWSLKAESVDQYLGLAAQQFRDMLHLQPAGDVFLGLHSCPFGLDVDWSMQAGSSKGKEDRSKTCSGGVFIVSPGTNVVALWELDLLIRKQFSQLINETDQSLRSLLQLVAAVENLEIPAFIGEKVRMAQQQAEEALDEARNTGSYEVAMLAARRARVNAEVAQSHHSIATHHSYPAQHKVALYLPLFAPISLPLFVTLVREVARKLKPCKQA